MQVPAAVKAFNEYCERIAKFPAPPPKALIIPELERILTLARNNFSEIDRLSNQDLALIVTQITTYGEVLVKRCERYPEVQMIFEAFRAIYVRKNSFRHDTK